MEQNKAEFAMLPMNMQERQVAKCRWSLIVTVRSSHGRLSEAKTCRSHWLTSQPRVQCPGGTECRWTLRYSPKLTAAAQSFGRGGEGPAVGEQSDSSLVGLWLKTERTSELGPCEPSQHAKDSYTQTCALVHGLSLSDSAISSRTRRRGMHRRRATEVGGLGKHMGGCRLAVFPGQSNAVLENPNFTPAMAHSGCGNESQPSGSRNCGVDVNTILGSTQMQPHAGCIPTLHHTNELYIGVSCLSTTLLRGISRKPCCNLF